MNKSAFCFEIFFSQNSSSNFLEFVDGKLRTDDGQSFDIHQLILASSSNYFYALLSGTGKGRKDITIRGIKGDILSNILTYIYTGNIYITRENICDILIVADYLLLDELVIVIRRQLSCHLSVSNCLNLFVSAGQMNHSDILRESFRYIQMHFEAIVQDEDSELSDLPVEDLKKVLSDKNLRLIDESTVWLAIVKWVQAETINRQYEVPDLLTYLTIRDVNELLASRILEHSIVVDNPYCNEIHQMKMSNSCTTNFGILFYYLSNHSSPSQPMYRLRQPTSLNFIAHYCRGNEGLRYQLHVSYDENFDWWRKMTELDIPPDFLLSLGANIYAFYPAEGVKLCYNLIEKEWVEMANFSVIREDFHVLKLEGTIYALGYKYSDHFVEAVEVYDPERNEWNEVAAMNPVRSFSATALRKHIYVIGKTPRSMDFGMMAQVYDQDTDTWLLLSSPLIRREDFAVVAYHERAFVIGGSNRNQYLKAVEVFDPSNVEWTRKIDLPYAYSWTKAVVLHNNLIVYDDDDLRGMTPPVQWNDGLDCWVPLEPSSPLNVLLKYPFFTTDNSDAISWISRENRDPDMTFVKSPFN